MAANTHNHYGPTDTTAARVQEMHPELAARHADDILRVREVIQTLQSTDSDAIFLSFLDLLPCLEKLGNDFLKFKKPSMLKGDYDAVAPSLDLYVGAYQKDVQTLQRYFLPKLMLPLPDEYTRPREAALAYAEECNQFKPQSMGTPQRQAELMQRLQTGSLIPNPFPQIPASSQPFENTDQGSKAQERRAGIPTSHSAVRSPKKTRRAGPRVNQACAQCKRRKVKCGESACCIYVLESEKEHKTTASSSGQTAIKPSPESPMEPPPTYREESGVLQPSLDYDAFGGFGIAPRDLTMEYEGQDWTNTMPPTQATSAQASPAFDNDGGYGYWPSTGEALNTSQRNVYASGVTQNLGNGFYPNVGAGEYAGFSAHTNLPYRDPRTTQVSQYPENDPNTRSAGKGGLLTRNSIPVSKDPIHTQNYDRVDAFDWRRGVPRGQISLSELEGQSQAQDRLGFNCDVLEERQEADQGSSCSGLG